MAKGNEVVDGSVSDRKIKILVKSQNQTNGLSSIGSISGFSKNATLFTSMLRITNWLENLLISLNVAKEDKVVDKGVTVGTIQILSQSQKPHKFVKG